MNRVIDIDGEQAEIDLPIVKFPPIALRALLIEKDPVVWAHILETYVTYFEYLMQGDHLERLSASTLELLCIFLRGYLSEMADDKGRILSLGENHDVSDELVLLRIWVFAMVKKCGLMHLQIFGESLWNMVKCYVDENPESIRGLIDGSLKPQINTQKAQINRVHQIQQHLKNLIESGKFTRIDLKAFEELLVKKSKSFKKFNEEFLTTSWCESLESWWNKGNGRLSILAKELAIVTFLSIPITSISKVLKELGVSDLETLSLYPLIGSILVSEKFNEKMPGLKSKVHFLNFSRESDTTSNIDVFNESHPIFQVNEKDIIILSDFFPHLTRYQLSQILSRYDGNVELATNMLFENPSITDDIPTEEMKISVLKPVKEKKQSIKKPLDDNILYPVRQGKKKELSVSNHVPDEVRNKTLTRALQLMYEDDEDEVDDTYDDAEVERSATHGKISIDDVDRKDSDKSNSSKYDNIEKYLWELLKDNKSLFERSKRGSKERKNMKTTTTWSDEQIEGWARMLERQPKRAMILEERFIFQGNQRTGKTSFVQRRDHNQETTLNNQNNRANSSKKKVPQQNQKQDTKSDNDKSGTGSNDTNSKKNYARNEKNKSSRANHNRKFGHDKKMAKSSV